MFSLSLSLVALSTVSTVFAQKATFPATPLAEKRFSYPTGIPYQADTDDLIRGRQFGYNQCNSTTEGQTSRCQTSFINSIEDFCLWGTPEFGMNVGDHEGEMIAWCSRPGHGTRLIPEGTITGLQFMRTPDYVQIVGFLDQTKINILEGDWGGEMDPHGADLRGNPLGGLLYSNAWSGSADRYDQVLEWHNFLGGNAFCFKICDPRGPNAANFCEHIYDRIGCKYNAPNSAPNNTFMACEGENQDFPGTYTQNGQVMTYTQPPESLGAISTMPYEPRIPASSNCVTYESASLFAAIATVPASIPPGASNTAAPTTSTGAPASRSTTAGTTTPTGASGNTAGTEGSNSAGSTSIAIGGITVLGVIFSALFLS